MMRYVSLRGRLYLAFDKSQKPYDPVGDLLNHILRVSNGFTP